VTVATRSEVLAALAKPVDPLHHRLLRQGGKILPASSQVDDWGCQGKTDHLIMALLEDEPQ
jgi:hypothetical protein